ncbi:hypothetical protein [Polymorphospora sp. NPDC050346]|uniref:hypothetical protein n=1 Tax=Polymorphospora sp. NPDC050346 TaxID=3155780 RepID=UPI0033C6F99B
MTDDRATTSPVRWSDSDLATIRAALNGGVLPATVRLSDSGTALVFSPDEVAGPAGGITCTTAAVDHRHRPGTRVTTGTDVLLGPAGWHGVTACGQAAAMDQVELDLWYAERRVAPPWRRRIDDLPDCDRCFPCLGPAAYTSVDRPEQVTTLAHIWRSSRTPDAAWSLGLGFDDHLATLTPAPEPPLDQADAALAAAGLRRTTDWQPHFPRGSWGWRTAIVMEGEQ